MGERVWWGMEESKSLDYHNAVFILCCYFSFLLPQGQIMSIAAGVSKTSRFEHRIEHFYQCVMFSVCKQAHKTIRALSACRVCRQYGCSRAVCVCMCDSLHSFIKGHGYLNKGSSTSLLAPYACAV